MAAYHVCLSNDSRRALSFGLIYKLHLQIQNLRRTRDLLLSGQVSLNSKEV
jgi:hypothetical protein